MSATENQLCILLGRNPGPIERPASLLAQNMPDIPPGLPSSLLERRPDVRQAEQVLRSANAQVGESVAEFFPKIGLTAFLGKVSPELSALNAFREVTDALVSSRLLVEIRARQAHEVQALERAAKLSSERYVAGKASYYEVLEAQQELFPSQLNLARTQRDQLLAVVSLYKALGGGWQAEPKRELASSSSHN